MITYYQVILLINTKNDKNKKYVKSEAFQKLLYDLANKNWFELLTVIY